MSEEVRNGLMKQRRKAREKNKELQQENQQLKEKIEYYYEFDEELKKEDLPEELRPYYKNQDCCKYIVELRKENQQLKSVLNEVREYIKHSWWLRLDQVYDTSKGLQGWEVEEIMKILDKVGDK